jgi:hypothetical protein
MAYPCRIGTGSANLSDVMKTLVGSFCQNDPLCVRLYLESVSYPFEALMRSYPPIPVLSHAAWVILAK